MAKLIAFALAFTALVAFASAHSTIVTTTIEEENENPVWRQQCSPQIQGERFNQCQRYLQQGQSSQQQGGLQSCCQELQNVDEQCQCEAVKEAFRQAQRTPQQQGQQGGSFGYSQQVRQMKQKAQNLPNQCNLQTRQCQVGTIFITTTTTITENRRGSMQQCEHIRGRQFNQCQSYIKRQSGSSGTLVMSINRQGRQAQGLELCCNELQNVDEQCQCEAMQEVYRQAQQQQGSQQRGRQPQTQDLQQIVQSLRNECKLEMQQCRIPSALF